MKKIRILSIDGGGIRGVIPGTILTYLEGRLQQISNTDLKIGDYFDLVAGTSTGGILACVYLVPDGNGRAKFSAQDAVNLYLKEGPGIFHTGMLEEIVKLYNLFAPKYAAAALEDYLYKYFGETKLSELIKPCLITSYNIVDRSAVFFTSADAKETYRDFKVKDVARATSAAPTYFEPAHITSSTGQVFSLIDGGVFANNPALCAYAEARNTQFASLFHDVEKADAPSAKDMLIISLGTGTIKKPYYYKDYKNAGEIKWLKPLIDILMSGNAETVDYQLKEMYQTLSDDNKNNYYRLEPSLHEACPDIDDASTDNLEDLRQAGLWFIDKNRELLDEIAHKIIGFA